MAKAVSAADANRKFSLILRGVREGRSYVVTSHGRPVARIVPVESGEGAATNVGASAATKVGARARSALLARLKRQPVANARRWTRDELYDDEG